MSKIAQHHYIAVESPYPAHLFAITHPLRRADLHTTHVEQIIQKQVTVPFCPVPYGDDYDRVHRDDWLSAPGGFRT